MNTTPTSPAAPAQRQVLQAAKAGTTSAEQITTCLNQRRRRGKAAKTIALESAILRIVEQRHPVTVRGVCYALFAEGLIRNMSTGETGRISRVMTDMREAGLLDWKRIVDGSRATVRPALWASPDERVTHAVRTYRRNNWQDQPFRVEAAEVESMRSFQQAWAEAKEGV